MRSCSGWIVVLGSLLHCVAVAVGDPPPEETPAQPATGQTGPAGDHPRCCSVAVLDLVDRGPSVQLAGLRTALPEMLTSDLSQIEGLQVVERLRIDQFLREATLPTILDRTAAERAGRVLAATHLVTGSYQAQGETVTVTVMLLEIGRDRPLVQWTKSAKVGGFFQLERELAQSIWVALKRKPGKRPSPPPTVVGPLPTVAVLSLRNLGPSLRLAPMESGFAEHLQAGLGAVRGVRLVERQRIYAVLQEQRLSIAGLADPSTALQVGRLLHAERMIYGSFVELEGRLRLDVRLADSASATVLRAECAEGPTDQFARLVESLSLRLAADLATVPESAADAVRAATPTRNLEAALHFAQGQREFHLGHYRESAEAFQRVLLLEPKNLQAGLQRVRAWYFLKDYAKVAEAGDQLLASQALPTDVQPDEPFYHWRGEFFLRLAEAYGAVRRTESQTKLYRRMLDEFPATSWAGNAHYQLALLLLGQNRETEAVALLEKAVGVAQPAQAPQYYCDALMRLYNYYDFGGPLVLRNSRTYATLPQGSPERAKAAQDLQRYRRRATEVFDLAFQAARGKRDTHWRWWAEKALERLDALDDDAAREQLLVRTLQTFSWVDELPAKAHYELAAVRQRLAKWDLAIADNRFVLAQPDRAFHVCLPDLWDLGSPPPDRSLDRRIDCHFRIAEVLRRGLNQPDRARQAYAQLVSNFGLVHYRGADTVQAMVALEQEASLPEKAALVWGGGTEAPKAWADVLGPRGYVVHSVGNTWISGADLAPYGLVILVRTGMVPYTPDDVLALRSYVATGGSLLVVVSPGWERAQPGIHNGLLSLFNVQVGSDMAVRAEGTPAAKHPITAGIGRVGAKNCVHLETDSSSALIRVGDRTVLAATDYRHGRVVIASLGQWFLPKPAFRLEQVHRPPWHWTRHLKLTDLPLEMPQKAELLLLENVLGWLTQPHDRGTQRLRQAFAVAQRTCLNYELGTMPRETMLETMARLVDEMPAGTWKEEAIWAVGEASLRLQRPPAPHDRSDDLHDRWQYDRSGIHYPGRIHRPRPGWPSDALPPDPAPEHYENLLKLFPQSPLRPYAQWRLADCLRRQQMNERYARQRHPAALTLSDPAPSVVAAFEKVRAPEGSLVWAWTGLRLGLLHGQAHNHAAAVKYLRPVAERMPRSPEKTMALLDLGYCHQELAEPAEAAQYWRAALTEPNIAWNSPTPYAAWGALGFNGSLAVGESIGNARDGLRRTQRQSRSPDHRITDERTRPLAEKISP